MKLLLPSSKKPTTLKRRNSRDTPERLTVGKYLLKRLQLLGIKHIFGLSQEPLNCFTDLIDRHPTMHFIQSHTENQSSFIATGYAYVQQYGVKLSTYAHIEEIVKMTRLACEENLPLVCIIGTQERKNIQQKEKHSEYSFEEKKSHFFFLELLQTWATYTLINDPLIAAKNIDRAFDLLVSLEKPIIFELPEDVVNAFIPPHKMTKTPFLQHDTYLLHDMKPHLLEALQKNPLKKYFERILKHSDENCILILDDPALCKTSFLNGLKGPLISNTYGQTSFSLSVAIGTHFANKHLKPIIVTTPSFLAQSLDTLALCIKLKTQPVLIVINQEPTITINVQSLPELFSVGVAMQVETENSFETSLKKALHSQEPFFLIEVDLLKK